MKGMTGGKEQTLRLKRNIFPLRKEQKKTNKGQECEAKGN